MCVCVCVCVRACVCVCVSRNFTHIHYNKYINMFCISSPISTYVLYVLYTRYMFYMSYIPDIGFICLIYPISTICPFRFVYLFSFGQILYSSAKISPYFGPLFPPLLSTLWHCPISWHCLFHIFFAYCCRFPPPSSRGSSALGLLTASSVIDFFF
jgi:hypothetical protein